MVEPSSAAPAVGVLSPALTGHPDAVLQCDSSGRLRAWNAAAQTLLGLSDADRGQPLRLMLLPRDRGRFDRRCWLVTDTGRVPVEVTSWSFEADDDVGTIRVVRDVGREVAEEAAKDSTVQTLRLQARTDALTGLANRHELDEWLTRMPPTGTGRRQCDLVLIVDVDHFKAVNDEHGHAVGDEVLIAVGRRLLDAFRPTDLVARLGGDEFVVLTRAGSTGRGHVVDRVRALFDAPILTSAGPLDVTASIGAATREDDPADGHALMRHADKAMYMDKLAGPGADR